MQTESTSKYYYRYQVQTEDDLSEETIARRLRKAAQANACTILFDLTTSGLNPSLLRYFFKTHRYFKNIKIEVLVSLMQLPFIDSSTLKALPLHLSVCNFEQLKSVEEKLTDLEKSWSSICIHLSPRTSADLNTLKNTNLPSDHKFISYFWDFRPYDHTLKNSLTITDIGSFFEENMKNKIDFFSAQNSIKGLEIWNDHIPSHYELESEASILWQFETKNKDLKLSLVIPSFNNCKFLSNVIFHLTQQNIPAENFEIIVVEDGGTDGTNLSIQALFHTFRDKINLKFIYWSKSHPTKGEQNFFRAGLARNLGVRFAESELLFFLDSDMLVPKDFVETCIEALKKYDVIQFQRHHIHQSLSQDNPVFDQIKLYNDTYIEEKNYWNQLFQTDSWQNLPQFWKFTCTYALGVKKSDFINVGRFKKYYISYGFEDTDLGYELYKRKKVFHLIKKPLLHLTAYDQMQYRNSQVKRMQLLKKTSALFYLQHLDEQIFTTFTNFYRFEKPFIRKIKDLF